jgi:hypothetical protein
MTNNSSVPGGLLLPTSRGMLAGNPRDSAIASMQNTNILQAKANRMAGGKYKKIYGGSIKVPQFDMLYSPVGGKGTDPNSIIVESSKTSTQGYSDRVYDNLATKFGGYKIKRKVNINSKSSKLGGNPEWVWGCISGGKYKSKKYNKKTKKYNKKTKRYNKKNKKI